MNTIDIYFRVDTLLMVSDYANQNYEVQKEIIDMALIAYTVNKMRELGIRFVAANAKPTLFELLALVEKDLSPEDKYEFFRHYTHYILKIIASLQMCETLWQVCDEPSERFLAYTEDGLVDSLNTTLDADHFETFIFIYTSFQTDLKIEKAIDGRARTRLPS